MLLKKFLRNLGNQNREMIAEFSKRNFFSKNNLINKNTFTNLSVYLKIFRKFDKKSLKNFSLGYRAEDLDAKPIQKNKYDYVKLSFGHDARKRLLEGINIISDNVAITYGPLGKNVVIDNGENPIITKDGVTVAKHIGLTKRHQNIGCRLISIIAGNTNEFAGDGTTTATVIAGELSKIGIEMVNNGYHPIDIKKGIEFAGKILMDFIEATKRKIVKRDEIFNLAMITTNKDKTISNIITEALLKTGTNGFLNIEESPTGLTDLIILDGMTLTNGISSKDFLIENEDSIDLKECLIITCSEKINKFEYMVRILEFAKNTKKSLIFFCPQVSNEIQSMFVFNKRKNNLNCVCINIPDYLEDNSNTDTLEDISIITGSKLCKLDDLIFDDDSFIPEELFGFSKRATISEYETILTGTKGDKEEIKERLQILSSKIKNEENKNLKEIMKRRLSNLEGKTAIITVGGITEAEVGENRDKIVDCLNSCKSALDYGILPGGGTSFIHSIKILEDKLKEIEKNKSFNFDFIVGMNVFIKAIKSSINILFKNSETCSSLAIEKILRKIADINYTDISNANIKKFYYGFDIVTQKYYEDMIEQGIIDSYNTIKSSVQDAISVAGLIITTECIIYKEIDYEPPALEYFKNKFKSDPMARKQAMEKFYAEDKDDYENFTNVI